MARRVGSMVNYFRVIKINVHIPEAVELRKINDIEKNFAKLFGGHPSSPTLREGKTP